MSSCKHYTRRCALLAACCNKLYKCHLCHDASEESHKMDRKQVQIIKCLQCDKLQEVSAKCDECKVSFGRYFCETCRLFDDTDKGQYHCDDCGICRVGGKDNFFHCMRCDMCLGVHIKESHKCIEKSSRTDCPVCLEDIHTSRIPAHVPPCGHLLHRTCFSDLLTSGGYTCPVCNASMVDMKQMWQRLDNEIANTPMPEAYSNFFVTILCRDCHKESRIKFHVLGMRCAECGSYNTSREGEEGVPVVQFDLPPQQENEGNNQDEDDGWETEEEEEVESDREHGNEADGEERGTEERPANNENCENTAENNVAAVREMALEDSETGEDVEDNENGDLPLD